MKGNLKKKIELSELGEMEKKMKDLETESILLEDGKKLIALLKNSRRFPNPKQEIREFYADLGEMGHHLLIAKENNKYYKHEQFLESLDSAERIMSLESSVYLEPIMSS